MMDTARIIFAGGGTGGHLYPAIAIANRVKELLADKMKVEILFIGTKRGLEYRIKDSLGYPLETINIRGLVRSFTLKNLLVPFAIVSSLIKVSSIFKKFKPHVVVGTGGYVCWPVVSIASKKNIPAILQEQNSFPGLTTRKLATKVQKIFLGFADANKYLPKDAKTVVSGNPVRTTITTGNRDETLRKMKLAIDKKTILILGGSQGAKAVNNAVLKSLERNSIGHDIQILWQTGKRDYTDVTAQAGNKGNCSLFPFAHDMENIYAAADIAIARAGALTLAELIECNIPAVLIPYPHAAGDHQRENAKSLVERDAAMMIDESELSGQDILSVAETLLKSEKYGQMKEVLKSMSHPEKAAVDIIAGDIIEILYKQRGCK